MKIHALPFMTKLMTVTFADGQRVLGFFVLGVFFNRCSMILMASLTVDPLCGVCVCVHTTSCLQHC